MLPIPCTWWGIYLYIYQRSGNLFNRCHLHRYLSFRSPITTTYLLSNSCYFITMGFFHLDSEEAQAHAEVEQSPHKAALSHELLSAAAAYEASKAYEQHVAANGHPDSHAKAKELIASFSGAFIDRMVETKGLDFVDAQKAKHEAKKRAEEGLESTGHY